MYLGKHYKLKVIKGQKYNVKLSDKYTDYLEFLKNI